MLICFVPDYDNTTKKQKQIQLVPRFHNKKKLKKIQQ